MQNLGAEHANLDQKVYQILKSMIMDRKLLPGEKIRQEKLAGELGISRTPLVAALKFLEHEKLVESKPRRGFFVRLFEKREMISIFELREVLEGLAARRATAHMTDKQLDKLKTFFSKFKPQADIKDVRDYSQEDRQFHNYIIQACAKEFLRSILETYNIISFSYQVVTSEGLVRAPNETLGEHLAVIEAICDRDPEAAESHMRSHFRRSIAALMAENTKLRVV